MRRIFSRNEKLTRMASINHLAEEKFRSLKSNSDDTLMSFYASCVKEEEQEDEKVYIFEGKAPAFLCICMRKKLQI